MAEENKSHEYATKVGGEDGTVETKDRGLFDFLGKKEEEKKPQEVHEGLVTGFDEKVKISEAEEKKHGLFEKHHRQDNSSSSSSDEEEGIEGEEKKKKKKEKKGLKDKFKEKISGDDNKEEEYSKVEKKEDTSVPIERIDETNPYSHEQKISHDEQQTEEKKGFLEKIKEKLPGQNKSKNEEHHVIDAPPLAVTESTVIHHEEGGEAKEKKGFLEKIKEKLPGYHPKNEEDKEKEKEKEKETAGH